MNGLNPEFFLERTTLVDLGDAKKMTNILIFKERRYPYLNGYNVPNERLVFHIFSLFGIQITEVNYFLYLKLQFLMVIYISIKLWV